MKIYPGHERGLYLGRYEEGDEHAIINSDGTLKKAHTVRPIHLTREEMRKIIEIHDGLPSTHSAAAQQVYDETCVDPFFNTRKLLAPLAAGSRERYDELKPAAKQAAKNIYGPPSARVEYDSNMVFRPRNTGIDNAIPGTVNPDDPTFLSLGPKRSYYEALLHKTNTGRYA